MKTIATKVRQIVKSRLKPLTLGEYLESYCQELERRGHKNIATVRHVCRLAGECYGAMKMKELDRELYFGFNEFLSSRYRADRRCKDGRISQASRRYYLTVLNTALNVAVRKGIVDRNPFCMVALCDKVRPTDSTRQYLTIDELRRMIATPMPQAQYEEVKRAYLFSCFCGLRLSDVKALRWEQISSSEGRTMVEIKMQKTGHTLSLPISDAAKAWLTRDGNMGSEGRVFQLPHLHRIENCLRQWAKAAGIGKHLTYHTSRHTFATMMMTLGSDIYTTSKLLGHADIRTTQIYARIIDKKKEEAVDRANAVMQGL